MKKIFGMVAIAVVAAVNVVAAFDSASIMNELGFANIESLAKDSGEPILLYGATKPDETPTPVWCKHCKTYLTGCMSNGSRECTPIRCQHIKSNQ